MVAEADVPAAAVIRVFTGEEIELWVDCYIIDVPGAMGVSLHPGSVRADADHAPAEHGQLGAIGSRGVHEAEISHRDVDPAVDSHADSVRRVIGPAILVVLRHGDILDEGFRRAVGHPVLILVLEDGKMHAGELARIGGNHGVEHVEFVAHRDQPARVVDHRKHGVRVRLSVVMLVHKPDNAALARPLAQRSQKIHPDVNLTRGGCTNTCR